MDNTFEDMVLSLMGRRAFSPPAQGCAVRLLMLPSFDPASCLIMEESDSTVTVSLTILRDTQLVYEAFLAARRDTDAARRMYLPAGPRWEDIAEVPPAHAERVRNLYEHVHPTSLREVPLDGLDGITIRLWYWGPGREHSIRMWSPTAARHPAQHAWISLAIDVAYDSFTDPYALAYLGTLKSYIAA